MSLAEEKFNLGMTLWHELAHVFHIQLSDYHVPRWFTEGLAEYETLIARAEWSRQHDPDLFEALRSKRMPHVANMSRAFTRAEQMSDVATAYYASSKILSMLAARYGMAKLTAMLKRWGAGVPSSAVIQETLEIDAAQLDALFRDHTRQGLARYEGQFVPILRAEPAEKLRALLRDSPGDQGLWLRIAVSAWRTGRPQDAKQALGKLDASARKSPDALYLAGRLALEAGKGELALAHARRLVASGHDGHWTQLLLAESLLLQDQPKLAQPALRAASAFDPTQSEPLRLLHRVARSANDEEAELLALRKLAELEQHSGAL
jgi:hypothetical protein